LGDADATNLAAAKKHADDAIAALDVEDTAVAGQYVSAVSEVDGKISVTRADLPVDVLETGDANGQVKFNGTNVDVKGLGSAAYENVNAFAVKGTETVASDAKTLAEANEDAIEAMQLGEVSGYIKSVSQLNGKVSASAVSAIPSTDITVVSDKLTSTTVAKALDEIAEALSWAEVSE
jgi:hypothetical protein